MVKPLFSLLFVDVGRRRSYLLLSIPRRRLRLSLNPRSSSPVFSSHRTSESGSWRSGRRRTRRCTLSFRIVLTSPSREQGSRHVRGRPTEGTSRSRSLRKGDVERERRGRLTEPKYEFRCSNVLSPLSLDHEALLHVNAVNMFSLFSEPRISLQFVLSAFDTSTHPVILQTICGGAGGS
ncbi:hypothetical protein SCHPADRAFT_689159 [Schizopora paradoxa]|uniref:Uncharacterized protein n=1 Tax=Schizopora paradoxa TaxID=27342 RepID=A0A0H2R550_9AGAM|nr:hypothetical protein SCHPADRAFT_689159 [Schizopora paradoxa]